MIWGNQYKNQGRIVHLEHREFFWWDPSHVGSLRKAIANRPGDRNIIVNGQRGTPLKRDHQKTRCRGTETLLETDGCVVGCSWRKSPGQLFSPSPPLRRTFTWLNLNQTNLHFQACASNEDVFKSKSSYLLFYLIVLIIQIKW